MKTLQEVLNSVPQFLEIFSDIEDIQREFAVRLSEGIHILFAWYDYRGYNGEAFVLFEQDGKLFEVNGGHCSCYGLEGQWSPEETTLEALAFRLKEGHAYSWGEWRPELLLFLDIQKEETK